jgi:signal transduction histidine kinase
LVDSSTRRKYGGLGPGLSIVKHLTEMHGGIVEVHSAGEAHRTTFNVPPFVEEIAIIVALRPDQL